MGTFLKKGDWFLGEVMETGERYTALCLDGSRHGEERAYKLPVPLSRENCESVERESTGIAFWLSGIEVESCITSMPTKKTLEQMESG